MVGVTAEEVVTMESNRVIREVGVQELRVFASKKEASLDMNRLLFFGWRPFIGGNSCEKLFRNSSCYEDLLEQCRNLERENKKKKKNLEGNQMF